MKVRVVVVIVVLAMGWTIGMAYLLPRLFP